MAKKKKRPVTKKKKKRRAPSEAPKKKRRAPKVGPIPGHTYPKQQILKDPKTGYFLPGNCANPYGRPAGTLSIKDAYIRALKRAYKKGGANGRSMLDELMGRMVEEALTEHVKDKLAVLKEAADRLEGKPAQTVHLPNAGKGPLHDATDDELATMLACKVEDDAGEGEG